MAKKVLYTALFGNYDNLPEPLCLWPNYHFICFTDQKHLKSKGWQIIYTENTEGSPVKMNRKIKFLPHIFLPEYEQSIYLDTNIQLLNNFDNEVVTWLNQKDLVLPLHPANNCLYTEGKHCIIYGKSEVEPTLKQLNKYKAAGMPKDYGLSENGIIIRNHNNIVVIKIMEQWWAEFNLEGSGRDQLSLPFILWQNNFKPLLVSLNPRNSSFVKLLKHKTESMHLLNKVLLSIKVKSRRFYYTYLNKAFNF